MINKNKVIVTGGSSRFANSLKKIKSKYEFIYTNKNQLNILNYNSIKRCLKRTKPGYVLHLAGMSRPMIDHEKNISKSIDLNIIGTSNIVKVCSELKIKLIYFSTSYVYEGKKGNYNEKDPVLPWNNYAWSKLGGECAAQMYKKSLILRVCMTEKPFVHNKAFANVKLNFIFHDQLANILVKILNKNGIINIGGPTKTVYDFAKKFNSKIKKIYLKKNSKLFPLNPSMNLSKLNKMIK
jgi:dTDP-4-dehydrorhamnose reductase